MATTTKSGGECILHQAIKSGPNRNLGKYLGEVDFIGHIVPASPDSLAIRDEAFDLYPFMLAAHTEWSLKVVYGLLGANPFVIEPYTLNTH